MRFFLLIVFASLFITVKGNSGGNISKFKGRIGKDYFIEMEISANDSLIEGWYIYPNKSSKLILRGNINRERNIFLEEFNSSGEKTGYFSGFIDQKNHINGKWSQLDKGNSLEFHLVPQNDIRLLPENFFDKLKDKSIIILDKKDDTIVYVLSIVFIVVIFLLLIAFYRSKNKKVVIEDKIIRTENEIKGEKFEEYFAKKLLNKSEFYEIEEKTSDKSYNGVHVNSNTNPDFLVKFKNNKQNISKCFAVECKYRSKTPFGKVDIIRTEKQFYNYKSYGLEKGVRVFIALGTGGTADNPDKFYIIPLEKISVGKIDVSSLEIFQNRRDYIFYEPFSEDLR